MIKTAMGVTRREFLGGAAATAAAATTFLIVPRGVLAAAGKMAPSDKINVATIGFANRGIDDMNEMGGEVNIVALCDVDPNLPKVKEQFAKYPAAKRFGDYRKMFDEAGKSFDAVIVATPDHTHAVLAMHVMKHGKHVYCEKPLCHSVYECRELAKAADQYKVVTQMGNQGHSYDSMRVFREWIEDGAIGKVSEIHISNSSENSAIGNLSRVKETPKVPDGLDWDLWLGPAQQRPYEPFYHPYDWRQWVPFGGGTVGDRTCHSVDPVFWTFDLGSPTTIVAEAKGYDPKKMGDTFPRGAVVTYEFPAKGSRGPITLKWFTGSEKPPRPKDLEEGRKQNDGGIVIGTNGTITYGPWGAGDVRIVPEAKMKAYKQPAKKYPRVGTSHQKEFLRAIRENRKANSDFGYGGALTEIAMLGNISIRCLGTKLEWDTKAMKFANSPEATAMVNPPYRTGWSL
jgi:predicted dehydrogenase